MSNCPSIIKCANSPDVYVLDYLDLIKVKLALKNYRHKEAKDQEENNILLYLTHRANILENTEVMVNKVRHMPRSYASHAQPNYRRPMPFRPKKLLFRQTKKNLFLDLFLVKKPRNLVNFRAKIYKFGLKT